MAWPRSVRKVLNPLARNLGLRPQLKAYDSTEFLSYVARKRAGLSARENDIETLVIGSSHADYGFNPIGFRRSFNASLVSGDLYTSYMQMKKILTNCRALRNVIVFYSVFSPGYNLIKTRERHRAVSYGYFFEIPLREMGGIDRRYRSAILRKCETLSSVQVTDEYFGFESGKSYMSSTTAENRAATHLRENERDPLEIFWLKEMARLSKCHGVNLWVVIPPCRSDYRNSLPGKSYLLRHLDFIEGNSVRSIDLFGSSLFEDEDMGDADHLNPSGALKLARHLSEVIR